MNDGDIVIVNRRPPLDPSDGGTEKLVLAVYKDVAGTMTLQQIPHLPALHLPVLPQAGTKAGTSKPAASDMG